MLPKKQLSGAHKRKKRKHDDQLVESQRDALHKFFVASSNVDVNEAQEQETDHGQPHDHDLNADVEVSENSIGEEDLIVKIDVPEYEGGGDLHPSFDHENLNGDEQE